MGDLLRSLQDPILVAKFQKWFGLEIIEQIEKNPNEKWLPVELRERHDREDVIGSAKTSKNIIYYKIHHKFWYYCFKFGSCLGEEIFYALFFSFLVWNVDAVIGRRVFLVAYFVFYIGQALKEVLQWPRPAMPPVVRLEVRWENEFGMPSTHCMMALALPLSLIFYTWSKPYWISCLLLGVLAFLLVSTCRLYLGMHTLLDLLVGMCLSFFILVLTIPLANQSDEFLLTSPLSPVVTCAGTILAVTFYPQSSYSQSRGETALLVAAYNGLVIGSWISFQLGEIGMISDIRESDHSMEVGIAIARQSVGVMVFLLIYLTVKPLAKHLAAALMKTSVRQLQAQEFHLKNRKKIRVDLISKFTTFFSIGLSATTIVPQLFRILACDRAGYWSETFNVS